MAPGWLGVLPVERNAEARRAGFGSPRGTGESTRRAGISFCPKTKTKKEAVRKPALGVSRPSAVGMSADAAGQEQCQNMYSRPVFGEKDGMSKLY